MTYILPTDQVSGLAGRGHFHIALGRHLNATPVIALIHDLDITITNATTGEILRELTLDTTRRYQPQNKTTPGPTGVRVLPMS